MHFHNTNLKIILPPSSSSAWLHSKRFPAEIVYGFSLPTELHVEPIALNSTLCDLYKLQSLSLL